MKTFVKLQSLLSLEGVSTTVSKKSLLSTTAFSLALAVGLVTIPHLPTWAESRPEIFSGSRGKVPTTAGSGARVKPGAVFEPREDQEAPSMTTGGGSRTSCIIGEENSIIPLMLENNLVLTVSKYPTFFFYLPKSTAQTARFKLVDEDLNDLVYQTTFKIPSTPDSLHPPYPKCIDEILKR